MATSARASQRGSSPSRRRRQALVHDTASISRPTPTIRRKAKNTGSTGGCRSKASSPVTSPSSACRRYSDASPGTAISKRLLRVASSGMPNSTAGTPRPVCQMPSIAASLAGWCSSVFRPWASPAAICRGISAAASTTPVLSAARTSAPRSCRSQRYADSPASRNATVSPEASSICVKRYGNDGLKMIASQLAGCARPSIIT
ncbi:hypothetical protein GO303_04800 [Ralstonia solanacearum]|nr:hypothetical protein [Ralstonia solanacearum]NKA91245.1 hypothetical protein [Ralstonia solanacearum]NKB15425.1 hypothetical protein [Ralstonia solanacearum]NKF60185.1 hypothetical protein [Ralstonia solanacearum]NKF87612.1 hypothetical protein [Ralstonia solanacearum]